MKFLLRKLLEPTLRRQKQPRSRIMTDSNSQKETIEKRSYDILSQIKEMQHYSISNIEKLTGFHMELEDELKQKDIANQVDGLLNHQHRFNDAVGETIGTYEKYLYDLES